MSASRQFRPLTGGVPPGNRRGAGSSLFTIGSGHNASARIGKYEVEAEMRSGTLVRGFQAWDRATGRRVALKVLTDVTDKSRVERFRREVSAMANVRHSRLISIYELGEHVGMQFAAVEHLEDDNLAQLIAGRRALTLLEKIRVMWQVAEGAHAAHQGGLAYVGLTPSGVAVSADGSAKIQDFGIVRLTADLAEEVEPYQEKQGGRSLDGLSDVFAFGVIYYELLTGVHPFEKTSEGISGQPWVPVRDLAPECPEPLEQLVARAMEPDRELRYQNLDEVQYDAEPILREMERTRAAALLEEAQRRLEDRQLDDALHAVREALELDPRNSGAQRLRAELRRLVQERAAQRRLEELLHDAKQEAANGRLSRAAELLETAARLDVGNAGSFGDLQEIRSRIEEGRKTAELLEEARRALEENDLAAAESKVLEALEREPENRQAIELADAVGEAIRRHEQEQRVDEAIAKAKSMLLLESFDAALEILLSLEKECPGWATVGQWLAHVEEQKNQHERRARFDRQLEEARARLAGQQFAEAAEILEGLRTAFPGEHRVSDLLIECGAASERASTLAEARLQCGALCRQEQFEQAFLVVDSALRAYPDDPDLAALRGEIEQMRRDAQSAALIRQVLEESQWLLDQDRVDLAVQFLREKNFALPGEAALESRLAEVEQIQAEWEQRRLVQDCLRRVAAFEEAEQWSVALTLVEEALEAWPGSKQLQESMERLRALVREQEKRKKLARAIAEVRQLLADGDPVEAEHVLDRCLAALPNEPALLDLRRELESDNEFRRELRRAEVLVARGRVEEAEQILIRLDAIQYPEVGTLLKTVHDARAVNEEQSFYKRGREKAAHLVKEGQMAQAADLLRNLLSLFPGDPVLVRDLQAIVGGKSAPKQESAGEVVPAPPPPSLAVHSAETLPRLEHFEPSALEPGKQPVPKLAWFGRRAVIAGGGFFLLISAAAGVSRMLRSPSMKPPSAPLKIAIPVSTPGPAPVAAPPSVSPNVQAPPEEPAEAIISRPRERKFAPSTPPRRAFNAASLPGVRPLRTPSALVPTPPSNIPVFNVDIDALPAGVTAPLHAPAPPPRETPAPVQVAAAPQGGNLKPVQPIDLPTPVVPLIAKERRVSGVVTLEATVDKRGAVTNIRIINGNPLLVGAAREAVSQWKYRPANLNGQPIDSQVHIEVRFESGSR